MIMVRHPLAALYGEELPGWGATWRRGARPLPGGALVLAPLPVGADGQPFLGMDPSAPATWVRPWNPQPGMIAYLNFDGAKAQADTPMGGTWRNPMRDRADVKPKRWGRRRA
jgi:hypothetical protein